MVFSCKSPNQNLDKIEVIVNNEDKTLNSEIEKGFIEIVQNVYPKLMHDFNPEARRNITIKIDTSYNGVAFANKGQITVSSAWMHSKPEDLDLMTHEIMHIIQAYPNGSGPGWLTEGIADYVREKYGIDNAGAGWSMTPFSPSQHYTNSYRIAARFLTWLSQKYDSDIVYKLDKNLRDKTYSPRLWKEYTGENLNELWDIYTRDPKLM